MPQGSVLRLLLFLIYINDLRNISNKLKIFIFADDTSIYFESIDLFKVAKTVNEELKKLNLWLNINRLYLNISKTNFITFHPYNKPLKHNITFNINKKVIVEKEGGEGGGGGGTNVQACIPNEENLLLFDQLILG